MKGDTDLPTLEVEKTLSRRLSKVNDVIQDSFKALIKTAGRLGRQMNRNV
jgi:hypothetical protein